MKKKRMEKCSSREVDNSWKRRERRSLAVEKQIIRVEEGKGEVHSSRGVDK